MNPLKKTFLWLYYRIVSPIYERTIGTAKRKKTIKTKYSISTERKQVVIFGTPNHGNLGDYAIYVAEKKLFNQFLPSSNVFGINMTDFQHEIDSLTKLLKKEDLLILTGGGNLGNQYMDDETIRRTVIERFPDNRIVMFPQTLYFTEDEEGARERRETISIYNTHKDLWLVARDEQSYRAMQEMFIGKVWLLPDVVLTWGEVETVQKQGALLLLRNDVEGVLQMSDRIQILEMLHQEYADVEETDTEICIETNLEVLEVELDRKLQQINRAELIVTDRLHGMIMAAISHTPCIVLNNYNHKLVETYKWIAHLKYIVFVQDISELKSAIKKIKQVENNDYFVPQITDKYQVFFKEILNG